MGLSGRGETRFVLRVIRKINEAPPTAKPNVIAKKHTVVEGTDNAFKWAKQHKVKLAWGTDLMFNAAQMTKQNTDIIKLKSWFTPADALKLVNHYNAELLSLSGTHNPYPGKLGVPEVDALVDLIMVDGDPIADLKLMGVPHKNFRVIMKVGKFYRNILNATLQSSAATIKKAN
jgi:imidazolonepropionase-like amidohydrolase